MLLNFKSHITILLTNAAKSLYFTKVAAIFIILSEAFSVLHNLVSDYPQPALSHTSPATLVSM